MSDLMRDLYETVARQAAELTRLRGEVLAAERRGANLLRDAAVAILNEMREEGDCDLRQARARIDGIAAALYPAPATDTQGVGE